MVWNLYLELATNERKRHTQSSTLRKSRNGGRKPKNRPIDPVISTRAIKSSKAMPTTPPRTERNQPGLVNHSPLSQVLSEKGHFTLLAFRQIKSQRNVSSIIWLASSVGFIILSTAWASRDLDKMQSRSKLVLSQLSASAHTLPFPTTGSSIWQPCSKWRTCLLLLRVFSNT